MNPQTSDMIRRLNKARDFLKLSIVEVRALKNRLGAETIADFVMLYKEYLQQDRTEELINILNESIMNVTKTQEFVKLLERIFKFEVEILKFRKEHRLANLENKIQNNKQITGYKIENLDLDEEDKKLFKDNFIKPKLIYEYIPYWNTPIMDQRNPQSRIIRQLLLSNTNDKTGEYSLSEVQLNLILDHLGCTTINELIEHLRKYRRDKEYGIFDKADTYYLNRDNNIQLDTLKNFASKVLILAKERYGSTL